MLRKFREAAVAFLLGVLFVCSFGFVLFCRNYIPTIFFTMKLLIFMESDLLKNYTYADREKNDPLVSSHKIAISIMQFL